MLLPSSSRRGSVCRVGNQWRPGSFGLVRTTTWMNMMYMYRHMTSNLISMLTYMYMYFVGNLQHHGYTYMYTCTSTSDALILLVFYTKLMKHYEHECLITVRFHSPHKPCLLYTSPSPRDATLSRMPSSA